MNQEEWVRERVREGVDKSIARITNKSEETGIPIAPETLLLYVHAVEIACRDMILVLSRHGELRIPR